MLQKEGNILPAVEQQSGWKDSLEYVKAIEQAGGGCAAFIAANGFNFDFPVLFKSLESNGLMEEFAEMKLLFLDSLKIVT